MTFLQNTLVMTFIRLSGKTGRTILFFVFISGCFNISLGQTNSEKQPLQFIASVSMPGVKGRIDHLAVDLKNNIIFMAALGNNTVEVADLKTHKRNYTIHNLSEPQGLVFIPGSSSLFVTNGGNGQCDVFDTKTFRKISSINLGDDADNVRCDSTGKRIYAGFGMGGIAVIDANTFKIISEIKLAGHPESFQLDKANQKIYVNVPDKHIIEIIDLKKKSVVNKWEMNEAKSNFPMALDEHNQRLFIGCRRPAKLFILDTQSGKTVTSFDIHNDVDDIYYDDRSKQIYLSCGSGYIDIFRQSGPDTYQAEGDIPTRQGSRTSLFIPELRQLIVASPSVSGRSAELLIYKVTE